MAPLNVCTDRRSMAAQAGGIGFLRVADVNDSVRAITVDGIAAGMEGYKVKSGKSRMFVLRVKPAALATVKSKSKLLFKETVKVGQSKATVYKTLKLVRK